MINSLRTWFERDAGCVAARIPIFFTALEYGVRQMLIVAVSN
jgi:hypothetical protein